MSSVVPKLLDFFDNYKIKATFFTVTNLLEEYENEIKDIARKHEIASHSHTHNWLNEKNAEWEIRKSKETLEEFGIKCNGFRAPGFITTGNHFQLLKEVGYEYDSSLARYFPKRYNNPGLPKKPFKNKKIKETIMEFPMPTFVYPSVNAGLSYLKLCHPASKIFPKPYMFYLHPWEFLGRGKLPEANSVVHSFLLRNNGKKAWEIFENYVNKCKGKWVSCEEWMGRYDLTNL